MAGQVPPSRGFWWHLVLSFSPSQFYPRSLCKKAPSTPKPAIVFFSIVYGYPSPQIPSLDEVCTLDLGSYLGKQALFNLRNSPELAMEELGMGVGEQQIIF